MDLVQPQAQRIPATHPLPPGQARALREHYRAALFDEVIPWWMRHSLDQEQGGFFSLLEQDGHRWGDDKFMWMNGRQIWMLSHLYNQHAPKTEWLDAARLGADFLQRHAFREDGQMHFRLTREGKSRAEVLTIYTEVFAAIGLAEYAKASGDAACWTRAEQIYSCVMPRLDQPSNTPLLGYPLHQDFMLHANSMCRMSVAWVFNELQPGGRYAEDLLQSAHTLLQRHWKPEREVLFENVAPDGSLLLDLPEGRLFHPGHAIESAWMLMEIALQQQDETLFETCIHIVEASLKQGWDEKYGGLRYLTHIDGSPVHNLEADMKLWWPHCEALYALLLAWKHTGREDLAAWYHKVHDYTFSNFPDPEHGEWFGYLNRDGSRVWTAKATPWKGCFHLPRILYRCYQQLDPAH